MSFNFGGATSVSTPASTGFSFGANSAAATAPASAGFGFGAAPAASSTGFSFGGAPTAAPAASSGFSFSGASTGAAAPAATNSFGFGATSSAPSSFSTGGGFGATASSGFSFSGNTATAAPSAFGMAPAAAGTSSFGLLGGNAASPAATPAPGPAITLETVFEALPADVQKNMGAFHAFLNEQDQSDAFLKSVSPHQLEALQQNLARLEQDVLAHRNVQDKQETDVHAVRKDVRQLIHQVDTASLMLRSMDGSSANGNAYYSHIMRRVEIPSPYYWDLLDHFEAQMEIIKRQIEDVEAQFQQQASGNNNNSSSNNLQFHPAQLQQILMAQNAALMQVAARVAEVHESAEEMRELFLAKMRRDLERHGEKNPAAFKNPFDKRKKSAASDQDKRQAIDSIRFRTNVAPTIVSAAPQQQQPQPTPSAFGFNASPTFGSTTTGTTGFGPFGATNTAAPAATSTGGFGFGATNSGAATSTTSTATTAPTSSGGFSFGATAPTTAPKQVGFNLGGTTVASPTTVSPTFGFGAAAAAPTGGFGSISSSFAPGATSTTSNKRTGRLQKKRS